MIGLLVGNGIGCKEEEDTLLKLTLSSKSSIPRLCEQLSSQPEVRLSILGIKLQPTLYICQTFSQFSPNR